MPEKQTKPLSTRAIADRCSVNPDTVGQWIKNNGLPAIRLPGCYRIHAADFEVWLASQQTVIRK
jgi:excisionase family DNA binding protein